MKIYPCDQQRLLDKNAIALGIPGVLLMEHAALALYRHIETRGKNLRIVIVCGGGNNGGDGFALARLCTQNGYKVQLLCNVDKVDMSKDAALYAQIAQNLHIPIYTGEDKQMIERYLNDAQIIVDALYGSGLSREILGYHRELISWMKQRHAYTIGVDIPSGLYGDTGCIAGCVVKCDATICFGYGKLGLFINEGIQACGKIEIVDIALPKQLETTLLEEIEILDEEVVSNLLPKRNRNSHKGSYGKALLIGGSTSMSGAFAMAIQATLRCGVGTLTCAAPSSVCSLLAQRIDECMYLHLEECHGEISEMAQLPNLEKYDVIAIGNGMGRGKGAQKILQQVLACPLPCILDGDALYLAGKENLLKNRKYTTILTPHLREFSYLSGIEVSEILKKPSEALKTWIELNPHTCVALKNTTTLICGREKRYLNICGNDGLATGGSGDVLCGIVLAFLAQKANALDALSSAVFLHATCADYLVKQGISTYSLLPRDILEVLPHVLSSLINDKKT